MMTWSIIISEKFRSRSFINGMLFGDCY